MNFGDVFNENVTNKWEYMWDQRDRRLDGYVLMDSVLPTVFFCSFYAIFCIYIGPWFMQNKKPYEIQRFIAFYNFCMVLVNAYLHYQCWNLGWGRGYSFICEPLDRAINPHTISIVNHCYIYYLTKYIDWLDTVFFILRKKYTHVSGLHVYHHTMTPLNIWIPIRFAPGGHMTMAGVLNTFIHTIMYTYYTISSLGPNYKKYLWWKKYVTILQIIQFVVGLIHFTLPLFYDCGFPTVFLLFMYPQGALFIYMFVKFYKDNYIDKVREKQEKKHS